MGEPDKLEGEMCAFCHTPNLTLTEEEIEIPYFGKVFLFGMHCSNCKYHKSDVESAEQKRPCKFTLEVTSEEDMKIRVVRSSECVVKIPHIGSIEPGESAEGFISNVEGILQRFKDQIEKLKDDEDEEVKDKSRALIKKINRIVWGQDKCRLILEDQSGNSAIISEKAIKSKL